MARVLKESSLSGLPYWLLPSACGFYVAILRAETERRRSGPGCQPLPRLCLWCPFRTGSAKTAEKQTYMEPLSSRITVLHTHSEMTTHLPHTWYSARVYYHAIILFSYPIFVLFKNVLKEMPTLLFFQLEPQPYRGPSDSDPPPYSEHA